MDESKKGSRQEDSQPVKTRSALQEKVFEVIFGTDTPAGKMFDVLLLWAISISVLIVMLDTVQALPVHYHSLFRILEWVFTILFTVEYILRLYCVTNRKRYMFSFYGIVDLISILPSYLALFLTGTSYLTVVRLLRILRIFRVLKLFRYLSEANVLARSLSNSRRKIFVFFFTVLIVTSIFGASMYVIEGPKSGFDSIPEGIYWAIVTITTVGYGDLVPQSPVGRIIAALVMLIGYSVIAVPTGIITAELTQEVQKQRRTIHCSSCDTLGHDLDARYCRLCGTELPVYSPVPEKEGIT